jgi:hypothetical protein
MTDAWNRCEVCGRFIPLDDIAGGFALRRLLEPDSNLGVEKWETLCRWHYKRPLAALAAQEPKP